MVAPNEPSSTTEKSPRADAAMPDPAKIVEDLKHAVAEFREYAGYLVSLKLDQSKLLAKKLGLFAVLGIAALAVVSAMLATGAALLMIGLAGLIGYIFNSFFLGATILGVLLFLLMGVGAWLAYRKLTMGTMKSLRQKYADRRERQRQMFGHDIKEVARA